MGAGMLLLALSLGVTYHIEPANGDRHRVGERFTPAQLVHPPKQAFGAYEHGVLVRWGPVSTGAPRGTRVLRLGTPVLVIGKYNFEAPPPWQSLHRLARPVELPPQ